MTLTVALRDSSRHSFWSIERWSSWPHARMTIDLPFVVETLVGDTTADTCLWSSYCKRFESPGECCEDGVLRRESKLSLSLTQSEKKVSQKVIAGKRVYSWLWCILLELLPLLCLSDHRSYSTQENNNENVFAALKSTLAVCWVLKKDLYISILKMPLYPPRVASIFFSEWYILSSLSLACHDTFTFQKEEDSLEKSFWKKDMTCKRLLHLISLSDTQGIRFCREERNNDSCWWYRDYHCSHQVIQFESQREKPNDPSIPQKMTRKPFSSAGHERMQCEKESIHVSDERDHHLLLWSSSLLRSLTTSMTTKLSYKLFTFPVFSERCCSFYLFFFGVNYHALDIIIRVIKRPQRSLWIKF